MAGSTPGEMAPGKRRRLLQKAAHAFATKGYQGASLNHIIESCGISKSSFYHFIGSKDALFDAVVEEIGRELGNRLHIPAPDELAGPDFWTKISQLLTRLLGLAARESWSVDLGRLFHLNDVPDAGPDSLRRANAAMSTWLLDALAAGRRCGAVRDDLPLELQGELTASILWAMDRWALGQLSAENADESGRMLTATVAALRRLLEPDQPSTWPALSGN